MVNFEKLLEEQPLVIVEKLLKEQSLAIVEKPIDVVAPNEKLQVTQHVMETTIQMRIQIQEPHFNLHFLM
jgi:hypothetical protein